MPPKATPSLDRGAAGAQEHLGADLVPALPWVGFFDVPEGELVAEAGQEGTLAGGQAGCWQTVGRAVQQGRAPGGQVGEAGVGVGLDPAPVAGVGRHILRGH